MNSHTRAQALFSLPGSWNRFLNESGICRADLTTGNRPCDGGAICDRCQDGKTAALFKAWISKQPDGADTTQEDNDTLNLAVRILDKQR